MRRALTVHTFRRSIALFLIFAVFCSLFLIPCYHYVESMTREMITEKHRQKMEDGVTLINATLNGLSGIYQNVSGQENYREINYRNSDIGPFTIKALNKTIRDQLLTCPVAPGEVGLTYQHRLLFTRHHLVQERAALSASAMLRPANGTMEELIDRFDGTVCLFPAESYVSLSYGTYEGVVVAWRWSYQNDSYFFAVIPTENLFRSLVDETMLTEGAVRLNWKGQTICAVGREGFRVAEKITLPLSLPGLHAEMEIPETIIQQEMAPMRKTVMIFLLAFVLVMVMMVVLFAVISNRPLNRLFASLNGSRNLMDHLRLDQGNLDDLSEDLKQVDAQMSDYRSRLNTQVLERAMYQGIYTEQAIRSFRAAFPDFPKEWRLAQLDISSQNPEIDNLSAIAIVTEACSKNTSYMPIQAADGEAVLLVIPAGEAAEQALEQLSANLLKGFNIYASVTYGSVCSDIRELSGAAREMEMLNLENSTNMRPNRLPFSMKELNDLYMLLNYGDLEAATQLLGHVTAAMKRDDDFVFYKQAWRLISNMLVMLKLETEYDMQNVIIPQFRPDAPAVVFEEGFPECFRTICEDVNGQKEICITRAETEVLDFIQSHLSDAGLCIDTVTEAFDISAPTLQKRLKTSTGQTFSAYIEKLRMEKAKQELETTDKTVREIAEDCGYAVLNTFYKAYKRYYGDTPLSFRRP